MGELLNMVSSAPKSKRLAAAVQSASLRPFFWVGGGGSAPLVKLQTLIVTLMSALGWVSPQLILLLFPGNNETVTSQTWCVN